MGWFSRMFGGVRAEELRDGWLDANKQTAAALELVDRLQRMCADLREERRGAVNALIEVYKSGDLAEVREIALDGLRKAGVKVE